MSSRFGLPVRTSTSVALARAVRVDALLLADWMHELEVKGAGPLECLDALEPAGPVQWLT